MIDNKEISQAKMKWVFDNYERLEWGEKKIVDKSSLAAVLCYEKAFDDIMALRKLAKKNGEENWRRKTATLSEMMNEWYWGQKTEGDSYV